MISKKLTRLSRTVLSILMISALSLPVFAQNIRVDVEEAFTGCHQAAVYNNSNQNIYVTIDYEYKGRDGSFYQSRISRTLAFAGQKTTTILYSHVVDCDKPYTVRITNWRWEEQ